MTTFLLDTNILSAILRKETTVEQRLRQAVVNDDNLVLSVVVYYEIKRGLLKRDAKKQMATFEHLANQFTWCDMILQDWELAAHLWAERLRHGKPIADADVLIAAQAKRLDAILVTDNTKDFADLGVETANWKV
jgi:predicted nucleic acid-binding protein